MKTFTISRGMTTLIPKDTEWEIMIRPNKKAEINHLRCETAMSRATGYSFILTGETSCECGKLVPDEVLTLVGLINL